MAEYKLTYICCFKLFNEKFRRIFNGFCICECASARNSVFHLKSLKASAWVYKE